MTVSSLTLVTPVDARPSERPRASYERHRDALFAPAAADLVDRAAIAAAVARALADGALAADDLPAPSTTGGVLLLANDRVLQGEIERQGEFNQAGLKALSALSSHFLGEAGFRTPEQVETFGKLVEHGSIRPEEEVSVLPKAGAIGHPYLKKIFFKPPQERRGTMTETELETIAQTWSEHCKHKTLTGVIEMGGERIDNLLKSTIVKATDTVNAPWCLSVFKDNAGVIAFDEKWALTFKVETHNHPSAIDPYGGANTGLGGVIRRE
jgi:hypothetical protein